jgi:RNA polymerase sigma factor FliA
MTMTKTLRHPSAAHRYLRPQQQQHDAEHQAVQEHRALVVRMARALARRSGPGVDVEDLVAAGLMGVLRAVRCFDASHSVPFVLFAARHARWAMLTELRNTRPMRRTASERRQQLRRAEERLVHRLHQPPTREDLAKELDATPEAVARWQAEVSLAEARALHATHAGRSAADASTAGGGGHGQGSGHDPDDVADLPDDHPLPDDIVVDLELAADLHRAIADLPPRLAGVVRTTYFEGRRLADVAQELGVTESRVSQLRTEAVLQLRHRLQLADRIP